MNRVYKLVWSVRQQAWVVGSELAKSAGKASAKTVQVTAWLLSGLLASAAYAIPASNALPTGESVVAGAASFDRSVSNQLTVNQSSNKLINSWNSFNVGASAKVVFNQPDASSIALNRVTSGSPTEIFGQVTANGQLVLVNPAGLTVGGTGQVNAASVIASTLDISDSNFNAGKLSFERGSATGEVNNQGSILSANGSTILLAPVIRNTGTTHAMSGNVVLANANKLTLDNHAVTFNQALSIAGLIQNTGTIRADRMSTTNGRVLLLGDKTRVRSSVQLAGVLNANAVEVSAKTVEVIGTLDSNASTSMNAAGSIYINGTVNMSGNSQLVSLTHATTADNGYFLGENGKISMPGASNAFQVNGKSFSLIQTLEQLQAIGSSTATLADNYVIVNDIDASNTASTSFNPLGSSTRAFTGSINGLGNTVKNLNINKPSLDNVGLVGYAIGGQLKNIRLTDVNIIGRNHVGGLVGSSYGNGGILNLSNNVVSGTVKGKYRVGGLLGYASINAMASLNVTANTTNTDVSADSQAGGQLGSAEVLSGSFLLDGGQVDGLTHASTTAGVKYSVGGLVGYLSSSGDSVTTIQNSVANGSVNSTREIIELGGAFGRVNQYGNAKTTLKNIEVNGAVTTVSNLNGENVNIGGLVGVAYNDGLDVSSFIIDKVKNNSNIMAGMADRSIGGLIGSSTGVLISNSISSSIITGGSSVGGLIGIASTGSIVNSVATGSIKASYVAGGLVGVSKSLSFNNNASSVSVSGINKIGGLVGQSEADNIVNNMTTGQIVASSLYAGGLIGYSLQTSVSASSSSGAIEGGVAGGLIGHQKEGAVSSSNATGNVVSQGAAGGLIGENYGAVISDSHATGNIRGYAKVGGLVGYNEGAIGHSYATGTVSGGEAGGLVGYNIANIQDSYATGAVSGCCQVGGLVGSSFGSIISSYASGNVTGNNKVGGLVGYFDAGSNQVILNGYASGNVIANYAGGGLIGTLFAHGTVVNVLNNYASGTAASGSGTLGEGLGGLIGTVVNNNSNSVLNIKSNEASGAVTGTDSVGGLIGGVSNSSGGKSRLNIVNNYATGSVVGQTNVGGFIGHSQTGGGSLYITDNYANGLTSGVNLATLGGFIGSAQDSQGTSFITRNYWDKTSSDQVIAIGMKQLNRNVSVKGLTSAQMTQQSSFAGWDISNQLTGSNSIWYINEGVSAPVLRSLMSH